jgi:hypothetical protein|tara:strand:- start:3037 stop:3342 length:306 start_codon:yes stop_codon:yes gene_type:complete
MTLWLYPIAFYRVFPFGAVKELLFLILDVFLCFIVDLINGIHCIIRFLVNFPEYYRSYVEDIECTNVFNIFRTFKRFFKKVKIEKKRLEKEYTGYIDDKKQ